MCVLAKPICGLISGSYTFQQGDDYYNAPYVLMILAAMMATYSIGDIIYGQILLPMKKEKYYLIAISVGALVNAGASIGLGMFLFKDRPAIGVAIGTVTTDVLIIIFLLALTWKWTRKAVFNMNTLKLLIANAVILGVSLLIYNPLLSLWKNMNLSDGVAYTLQLVAIVAIAGIIYLVILFLLKEDLIYSFSKKRKEERKNAESES